MLKTCEKRFFKNVTEFLCKKTLEETPNIREMRQFWKSAILQRLNPFQNAQFGSKIKNAKNMRKTILQERYRWSLEKPLEKIREMRQFWKSVILQRLNPFQNAQSGSKIKNTKNMRKTILQELYSCSVQNPLEKTPNIWEMRQFWKTANLQRL